MKKTFLYFVTLAMAVGTVLAETNIPPETVILSGSNSSESGIQYFGKLTYTDTKTSEEVPLTDGVLTRKFVSSLFPDILAKTSQEPIYFLYMYDVEGLVAHHVCLLRKKTKERMAPVKLAHKKLQHSWELSNFVEVIELDQYIFDHFKNSLKTISGDIDPLNKKQKASFLRFSAICFFDTKDFKRSISVDLGPKFVTSKSAFFQERITLTVRDIIHLHLSNLILPYLDQGTLGSPEDNPIQYPLIHREIFASEKEMPLAAMFKLRKEYPMLPDSYFDHLVTHGWGRTSGGLRVYKNPINAKELYYPKLKDAKRYILLGDNLRTKRIGYDISAKGFGYIDQNGEWVPTPEHKQFWSIGRQRIVSPLRW